MSAATTTLEFGDTLARTAEMAPQLDVGEKLVLNIGPSHPSTHGVLRLVLELDGEVITKADTDVGYLHRGDEKIAENMTLNQFVRTPTGSTTSPRWPTTWPMPVRWKS